MLLRKIHKKHLGKKKKKSPIKKNLCLLAIKKKTDGCKWWIDRTARLNERKQRWIFCLSWLFGLILYNEASQNIFIGKNWHGKLLMSNYRISEPEVQILCSFCHLKLRMIKDQSPVQFCIKLLYK